MITTEILDFIKSFETITPAKLQIQFVKGYNWSDKLIEELVNANLIRKDVTWYDRSYYPNIQEINAYQENMKNL